VKKETFEVARRSKSQKTETSVQVHQQELKTWLNCKLITMTFCIPHSSMQNNKGLVVSKSMQKRVEFCNA
jgi:hypothetical protein